MKLYSSKLLWWQLYIQKIASLKPIAWILSHSLHHFDRLIFQISQGHFSFTRLLSGQKMGILTTIGAKSGKPRKTPLLYVADNNRGPLATLEREIKPEIPMYSDL